MGICNKILGNIIFYQITLQAHLIGKQNHLNSINIVSGSLKYRKTDCPPTLSCD